MHRATKNKVEIVVQHTFINVLCARYCALELEIRHIWFDIDSYC